LFIGSRQMLLTDFITSGLPALACVSRSETKYNPSLPNIGQRLFGFISSGRFASSSLREVFVSRSHNHRSAA